MSQFDDNSRERQQSHLGGETGAVQPVGPEVYRGPKDAAHVTPEQIATINAQLSAPWRSRTKHIDTRGFPVPAIIAMYSSKGWGVSVGSDRRSGDSWFIFEAPETP